MENVMRFMNDISIFYENNKLLVLGIGACLILIIVGIVFSRKIKSGKIQDLVEKADKEYEEKTTQNNIVEAPVKTTKNVEENIENRENKVKDCMDTDELFVIDPALRPKLTPIEDDFDVLLEEAEDALGGEMGGLDNSEMDMKLDIDEAPEFNITLDPELFEEAMSLKKEMMDEENGESQLQEKLFDIKIEHANLVIDKIEGIENIESLENNRIKARIKEIDITDGKSNEDKGRTLEIGTAKENNSGRDIVLEKINIIKPKESRKYGAHNMNVNRKGRAFTEEELIEQIRD